jgi:hypothetical protein
LRLLCTIALAAPFLCAQDAREIMRRAIELERKNRDNWIHFAYTERQLQREFDSAGKIKKETLRTYDVSHVDGSPYRRLVARNDQPLSPEEQKLEADKLAWAKQERPKETKEQREKRIGEWRRRQDRQREPIQELADAFDLKIAGEETLNGLAAWVIDGTPKAGYKPKSTATSFLPKLKTRFWIAKASNQWMKIDAETMDTVSYGALVLRISKGAHITLEQAHAAEGVWMPKRIALTGSARILLVKGYNMMMDFTYSNYRKQGAGEP